MEWVLPYVELVTFVLAVCTTLSNLVRFDRWRMLTFILLMALIASFAWNWQYLYLVGHRAPVLASD